MRVTLTLRSMEYNGTTTQSKSLGDINRDYIQLAETSLTPTPTPALPTGYDSFAAWADAVAKALNSLTTNIYADSQINANWSVNEEVND